MSVTKNDIECSTDSGSDVTEPKARSRPGLEVYKALGVRQTSIMYDCEVRVLLFVVFFYPRSPLATPIQFSAFSVQEARYRVKILTGCQGSKG